MEVEIARTQLRRGKANIGRQKVFDSGEIAFTTDTKRLIFGDGVTVGGISSTSKLMVGNDLSTLKTDAYAGDLLFYKNKLYRVNSNNFSAGDTFEEADITCVSSSPDGVTLQYNTSSNLLEIKAGSIGASHIADAALGNALRKNGSTLELKVYGTDFVIDPTHGLMLNTAKSAYAFGDDYDAQIPETFQSFLPAYFADNIRIGEGGDLIFTSDTFNNKFLKVGVDGTVEAYSKQLADKDDVDTLKGNVLNTNPWVNIDFTTFNYNNESGEITGLSEDLTAGSPKQAKKNLNWWAETVHIYGHFNTLQGSSGWTLSFIFVDIDGLKVGDTIASFTVADSGTDFDITAVSKPVGAVAIHMVASTEDASAPFSGGFTSLSVTESAFYSAISVDLVNELNSLKNVSAYYSLQTYYYEIDTAAANAHAAYYSMAAYYDMYYADYYNAESLTAYYATIASKDNAATYEAAAYTAMVNAGNSNKVATDDWRLGKKDGIWTTISSASITSGLTPITSFGCATISIHWTNRNHLTAGTTQAFTGCSYIAGVQFGFYTAISTGNQIGMYYNAAGTPQFSGYHTPPANWEWVHLTWNKDTRTFSFFYDNNAAATATQVIPGTLPIGPFLQVMSGWTAISTYASLGYVRSVCALNFPASQAERIQVMRGEYPQAWIGGTPAAFTSFGNWYDGNTWVSEGGTITNNSGTVTVTIPQESGSATRAQVDIAANGAFPPIQAGRVLRVKYTATYTTGSAKLYFRRSGDMSAGYNNLVYTLLAGTNTVDITVYNSNGLTEGTALILAINNYGTGAALNMTLTIHSVEILGAQVIVTPENWARTRGVDTSGNCNDLIYGTGVIPVNPISKVRTISITGPSSPTSVTSGQTGLVSGYTGTLYRDTKAIAAVRANDPVHTNPAHSNVFANLGGITSYASANGTVDIKLSAVGGNVAAAANGKYNLTHEII